MPCASARPSGAAGRRCSSCTVIRRPTSPGTRWPLPWPGSFTVVAPDLRGYGDSGKPASAPDHLPYSKRVMAQDQVLVMRALGHERFAVVGHDRGGRVAHRMALDHPQAVERLAVLDIAPTATMYARTDKEFATRYFWWFFLIQPYDLPERLIAADPEYFLRKHIEGQTKTPGAVEPMGLPGVSSLLPRSGDPARDLRGLSRRRRHRPRA